MQLKIINSIGKVEEEDPREKRQSEKKERRHRNNVSERGRSSEAWIPWPNSYNVPKSFPVLAGNAYTPVTIGAWAAKGPKRPDHATGESIRNQQEPLWES